MMTAKLGAFEDKVRIEKQLEKLDLEYADSDYDSEDTPRKKQKKLKGRQRMLKEKLYLKKKLVMKRRNKLHYQTPDVRDMAAMLGDEKS